MLMLLFYFDFTNQSEAQMLGKGWQIRIIVTTCLYVVIFLGVWTIKISAAGILWPYFGLKFIYEQREEIVLSKEKVLP